MRYNSATEQIILQREQGIATKEKKLKDLKDSIKNDKDYLTSFKKTLEGLQ